MAAPSGLTRFTPLRRVGPQPAFSAGGWWLANGAWKNRSAPSTIDQPPSTLFLRMSSREYARDEVQHVRRTRFIITVVADQATLDDVDLLLGGLVHHVRNQRGQLDRVLLVLEQLQLERLLQPLVGLVVELFAVDGEGADVVHDLAAEIVLAALRNVDLFLDRPHQALVGVLVVAGVAVAYLLALRVRLDVVD